MRDAYVIRLVTDYELLVNLGESDGAQVGEILDVLDPRTQNVTDPLTGADLGSIPRRKVGVAIDRVSEQLSLCTVLGRSATSGLSAVSRVMSGEPALQIRADTPKWPEGVEPGDPVVRTGRKIRAAKE
jgi:hypothetical protein